MHSLIWQIFFKSDLFVALYHFWTWEKHIFFICKSFQAWFLTFWCRNSFIVMTIKDSISFFNFFNVQIWRSFSFFLFSQSGFLSSRKWISTTLRKVNFRIFIKKWKFEWILLHVRIIFYESVFHFVCHCVHAFDFASIDFDLIFHNFVLDNWCMNSFICFFQTNDATIFDLRIDVSSVMKLLLVIVHRLYLSFDSNVWRILKKFLFDFSFHHDESFCTIHDQRCFFTITTINSLESKKQ